MNRTLTYAYVISIWLFLLGVTIQVFLAGLVVVARQIGWDPHIGFGHFLSLPLLIMLVTMYVAKMPPHIKRLTWLLFAVYIFQSDVVIFLRNSLPYLSALHPVLALFDFAIAWALIRHATPLIKATVRVAKEPIQVATKAAD